ncbi:MAG: hypothetical protein NC133_01075 [Prevotella sp.]|nr:hypothetical protein [Prevotella sp.]
MYPLYFYICLLASVASIVGLILLAIVPVNLPLVAKKSLTTRPTVRHRKARSPTARAQPTSYWDAWNDDDEDL